MANSISRDLYLYSSQNKTPVRDKIGNRYLEIIKKLNNAYDGSAAQIKDQYRSYRDTAGAQAAITQQNTASALAQKGLSKSGESIQSALLNDMAYMGTLSDLAQNENRDLSELNAQRISAIAGVQNDMLNAQNEADRQETELEYQKERDAKADEKWEKEFNYNASRDSVSDYKWNSELERQKSRDAESDRKWNVEQSYKIERDNKSDDKWQREQNRKEYESDRNYDLERDKFEADKAQKAEQNRISNRELDIREKNNNSESYLQSRQLDIKQQYLDLEKEKQAEAQAEKEAEKAAKNTVKDELPYTINDDGYIVPEVAPSEFMEFIIQGNGLGTWANSEFIRPATLKERTEAVINNIAIDPDYRRVLEMYARARGIIN